MPVFKLKMKLKMSVFLKDPPYGGNLIKPPWFEGGKNGPEEIQFICTLLICNFLFYLHCGM